MHEAECWVRGSFRPQNGRHRAQKLEFYITKLFLQRANLVLKGIKFTVIDNLSDFINDALAGINS